MRLPALLLALLAAAPTAVACAPSVAGGPTPNGVRISGGGEFAASGAVIVYDRKLAPEGAQASATVESVAGQTRSSLVAEGLLPNRSYGVHLHVNPCGAKPDDAGPHYQHAHSHADATNEVWLDLKTDATGAGTSSARHAWTLHGERLPRSLVIHAEPTAPDGTAGSRVACLTLR
ncbi:superoxide dismutase family protein [Nonomuraea africana]|uniref:Cu-Zn family superoxide dismutase n=1 Tax=Nonomuraea africana TaxID=46171 RepID=A0ABR9KL60_9ACTN|nr:superoxide dismutase family protein [Nonomuraea africana]MBE1562757.1 Cu-Zn family superoxide dismutase [Nonomuraea africana]